MREAVKKEECSDYTEGTKPGKTRPICKYYERYMNGVCTLSPKHFMCEYWITETLKRIKDGY